ncbi:hypothetical protein L226DRAFT_574052 [Lentinus tigrinus ALCF2SS1-7]|uniref:Uncharacterized protein n=1 Tax=Lentinus tigrinus ALCF2SS1-6 TaxID=1328759 RepID=A0A5C2RWJ4_9APHY|nr:hypothetical protein L227DRAFT_307831 [Lentinus tigrinus ALCF2SS1-6]RPD71291.1 hypothetical protein L226DRAFT_574052 [Lentinus tigrinus ALCF2SS1-7]
MPFISPEYLPPTPSALKANSRWLQITILNRTHFTLQYIDTYFTSGEYFTRPTDVAPMSDMMFSALSNEFLAGCRGGTRFRIHLEDGTFRDLAIGWANPPIGRYKAGVVFGRSPRVACEYASSSGEVVVSPWTWDRNVEGKSVAFELRITVEPGLNPVFLVEEVVMLS